MKYFWAICLLILVILSIVFFQQKKVSKKDIVQETFDIKFDKDLLHSNLYAPASVKANNITSTSIKFSWEYAVKNIIVPEGMAKEYANLSGFRIYRDGFWFKDVAASAREITDRGLYPGEKYSYSISALTFDNKIEGVKSVNLELQTSPAALKNIPIPDNTIARYLAEGDSVTQGQKAVAGLGYVDQLGDSFIKTNPMAVTFNKGESGSFSQTVVGRIDNDLKVYQPDFVSLMIGENDLVAGDNGIGNYKIDEYRKNLRLIIKKVLSAKADMVLLSIPYLDCCQEKINVWNKAIRDVAYENGIQFIDIYSIMLEKGGKLFLEDVLHPNQKGHTLIAQSILQRLKL